MLRDVKSRCRRSRRIYAYRSSGAREWAMWWVWAGLCILIGSGMQVQGSVVGVMDASEFHYPPIAPLPSYGTGREGEPARYHPLVMCADAVGVRVTGPGVIDGQGAFWWNRKNENERPHLLELYNCSSVEVTGVTLRNSATWTLHPVYSSAIHIHHMSIDAPANSPNTDVRMRPQSRMLFFQQSYLLLCVDMGFGAVGN